MSRGLAWAASLVWGGLLLLPSSIAGQDIEQLARARGIPLPQGYWDRIAADPDFFTLPNGLFPGPRTEGPSGAPAAITVPRDPVEGSVRLPVVLALFADSPDPHVTTEQVRQSLFQGPTPTGTLTDFYLELSGGALRVDGDVFPWVRTSLTREEVVGSSNGLGSDAEMGTYLIDALAANDPLVDFGQYDNDGPDGLPNSGDDDGYVDALTFEFLEIAASCGGPGIWPHRSSVAGWNQGIPYNTDDLRPNGQRILVSGYIVQSVTDCTGVDVQTAGTISHEFGHVLGLPDYYHPIGQITPENRRWVLGCWALMAAGSWGCGPVDDRIQFGPTHMISWSKHWVGWLDYQEVGDVRNEEFLIGSSTFQREALRVQLDLDGQEYLLIEYRDQQGFDDEVPTSGVLVVHQDFRGTLRPSTGTRYFLRMAEADGGGELVRTSLEGGNRGEQGDAYGFDGAPARVLHNDSEPSIRTNTGTPTTVTIHEIDLGATQARIRLSTARDPLVMVPEDGLATTAVSPFGESMLIAGGAAPYFVTVDGGAPSGVDVTSVDDRLIVGGAATEEGVFDIAVSVADQAGSVVEAVVRLTVAALEILQQRLVDAVLDPGADDLSSAELEYLDNVGNANGALDIGDVRAWLLRED